MGWFPCGCCAATGCVACLHSLFPTGANKVQFSLSFYNIGDPTPIAFCPASGGTVNLWWATFDAVNQWWEWTSDWCDCEFDIDTDPPTVTRRYRFYARLYRNECLMQLFYEEDLVLDPGGVPRTLINQYTQTDYNLTPCHVCCALDASSGFTAVAESGFDVLTSPGGACVSLPAQTFWGFWVPV